MFLLSYWKKPEDPAAFCCGVFCDQFFNALVLKPVRYFERKFAVVLHDTAHRIIT